MENKDGEGGTGMTKWQLLTIGIIIGVLLIVGLFTVGGAVWYLGSGRLQQNDPARFVRRQYAQPQTAQAAAPPTTLQSADLYVFEPFDAGTVQDNGTTSSRPVELIPGQFGEARRLYIDAPLTYAMPGAAFLREATVMAWVRIDNQQDRSFIWAYGRHYPSAFYYPTHQYKLCMHFLRPDRSAVSSTLNQSMQAGRFYHLAQAWGPAGFFTYLDGVPVLCDSSITSGNLSNPDRSNPATTDDILQLGSCPGAMQNPGAGGAWKWNSDGIYADDFAVFNRQLTDAEVAGVAQSGVPLADILQP